MSSFNTRASIVQFFGSLALGILIGGLVGYIGNTELVHLLQPIAIVFFAGIGVLVAAFLFLDAWRRRAMRTTIQRFTHYFSSNREALTESVRLLQDKRVQESLAMLPRPSQEDFDGISRLAQAYLGIITASTLINVSIAAAAALLAAAMVAEQNELIEHQNQLIDLQGELARNKARASAIEYVDRRYYMFSEHEPNYPSGEARREKHYAELPAAQQSALHRYWALVYSQWYTLGGYVDAPQRDLNTLPSYAVWEDYLVPFVREAGHQRATGEALCINLRRGWWPTVRDDFVAALMPALAPQAATTFLPCCTGDDVAPVADCARLLTQTSSSAQPSNPDLAGSSTNERLDNGDEPEPETTSSQPAP